MRGMFLLVLAVACRADTQRRPVTAGPIAPYDPLPYVDPLIGTGGIGAQVTGLSPGASAPFGLTLVGPDTRSSAYGAPSFYHFGGYHYDDDLIEAFSHTHAHGMGVNDYGAIAVMPRARWEPGYTDGIARAAPFTHAHEEASPGRYAVTFDDDGTSVEIVATPRGAHHRYRFAPGAEPVVIFDLGHEIGTVVAEGGWLDIDRDAGRVTGFQQLSGSYSERFGGLLTHFAAQVDPPPASVGTWDDPDSPVDDAVAAQGAHSGGWLIWPPGTEEVHVRVALSYVDPEGALTNLAAELPDTDIAARQASVEASWRSELEGVRVRGGRPADLRAFHTAQYHARLMPSLLVDADGRYRGIDGEVHHADFPYRSDFSLWDTFRTQHPWFTLVSPDRQRELLQSLVRMTEDGGSVPRWPLAHGYTGGMVGSPADQVFAGSYLKGIDDGWDVGAAWDGVVAHAFGPVQNASRAGIEAYRADGFVSFEAASVPASRTLEYAWSDHALALWGAAMGATEAPALAAQAGNWANTWDPASGFFRGRHADGTFDPLDDPFAWEQDFVEGNAWHYLWYVPWDVPGMIARQHDGDRDAFLARLEAYWEAVIAEEDDDFPDDWYWHGNEPVLHYVALGSLAGAPDLSARPARHILATRYDDTPLGLDGNDDAGTLSAWYLFNAIGLFPVAGTATYALTSPVFERVEIDAASLVITAAGASDEAIYVASAALDGEALAQPTVQHGDLVGRTLHLEMSAEPGAWPQ